MVECEASPAHGEALQRLLGLDQILMRLPPSVEDRAVTGGAEDLLVERALTALALRPQVGEVRLHRVHVADRLAANLRLIVLAVVADRALPLFQRRPAAQACQCCF
eukprot:CAMPEP_0202820880 /NCGR_PEP_ID=MMETSP1389-20130828/10033_1 /ASSEMBLY_ACC=CAM_ASM_000865 /TAXON_ID=302021 /ORGANISM="Rhodomonas sp., Strain CCMP768" /LENGTH=105 /DNA_ID=CAMNT_0049493597 /DNA_START=135 /DNA_END=449 /DNA_ORIENTATION=+